MATPPSIYAEIVAGEADEVLTQEMAAPMIDRIAGSVDRTDNVILDLAVGAGREEVNGRHERSRAVEGQQQRVLIHPSCLTTERTLRSA